MKILEVTRIKENVYKLKIESKRFFKTIVKERLVIDTSYNILSDSYARFNFVDNGKILNNNISDVLLKLRKHLELNETLKV